MTKKPVSVLICGAGSRGRTIYGQFCLDHPEQARVVAVIDPLAERRDSMAQDHGVPAERVFSDWRELAGVERLADAAIVATNDQDHLEPTLQFLRQGYHLLLEKPMAPDLESCRKIAQEADIARSMSAVCHVLRYTPYFRRLRDFIEQGAVGRVLSIRHFEPVNYWHFAHSFVRGNWRDAATTSPFILAKCCHDMDILLFLMGERPVAVHSFGRLSHFHRESAPPDTTARCLDCRLQEECTYSAPRFYGTMLRNGQHWWPLDVVTTDFSPEGLTSALLHGPYGRCVYRCDNNVCDHQVVNLEFESGGTGSLVATAFTEVPTRETDIFGSDGMVRGDGENITWTDFRTGQVNTEQIKTSGTHMGGDFTMLTEFFQAVAQDDPTLLATTPRVSLLSHQMALLAEKSRLERAVIRLQ